MNIINIASQVSHPYLKIDRREPKPVSNFFDRLKLHFAIKLYKIAYNNTKKSGILFFIGKCYQSLGQNQQALETFKTVWDASEFNPILLKEIGTMCLKLNRFEEGLRYAQKEVSEYPNDIGALSNLAIFLIMLKRIDDAYNVIKRAKVSSDDVLVKRLDEFIIDVKKGNKLIPDKFNPRIMFLQSNGRG